MKFLIEALMEQMKQVVAEKTVTQGTKHLFFDGVLKHKYEASDWDLDEWHELCLFGWERVATYKKFNANWSFWHSVNLEITERHVIVEVVSK